MYDDVTFNSDNKFDIQLSRALVHERRLAEIFEGAVFAGRCLKIELKSEEWQWRRTRNIAIEYQCRGQPSGIAVTEADVWVHQLCDDQGGTLGYLMMTVDRLKQLCRIAYAAGNFRERCGDGRRFDVVLLGLEDVLALMFNKP